MRVLLAVLLLAAPIPLLLPGASASPLAADAGASRFVTDGAPFPVAGEAFFGTAPYTYSWTHSGSGARFADAAAAATTFDPTGLSGDILLTLTVTDAASATATDTVKHYRANAPILLDVTGTAAFGTPFVQPSIVHDIVVPPGIGKFVATLDWDNPATDLDFEIFRPGGASATGNAAQTGSKPETATVNNPEPGVWKAHVYPFLSAADTYRLVVQAADASPLPLVSVNGPWGFGQLDAQTVTGGAARGAAPYTFAWDFDGDGFLEAPGATATATLPAGDHTVTIRVTDAAGYEVEATGLVKVSDADRVLRFQCGGDARSRWMMEFSSTRGTCWIHGGHHTYFTESTLYALREVYGFVFSVEQQLAWPTQLDPEASADPSVAVTSPIVVEISRDGDEFREAGSATYTLLSATPEGLAVPERQGFWFGFEVNGNGKQFRFLRVREPLSATQGLSGYLDNSFLLVAVNVVKTVTPHGLAPTTRNLSCSAGDILEDFFATHPCTFGGVDRWDAPSFWHTYYLGEGATLDRIAGSYTLAPFRTDDFFLNRDGAILRNPDVYTKTSAFVQTSVDGVAWTNQAIVPGTYGAPQAFDVTLTPGTAARFVRLFPEYHPGVDNTAAEPSLHHPRGFFLASDVSVTGVLEG